MKKAIVVAGLLALGFTFNSHSESEQEKTCLAFNGTWANGKCTSAMNSNGSPFGGGQQ